MPPPDSNLKLSEREIDLIKAWIKDGAQYEKHWAFVIPQYPNLPKVDQPDWPQNEIDYFILKKQKDLGLKPNVPADKEKLLKCISFDLTGLPPGIELMDNFSRDNSPNAYEQVVDSLLAQTSFESIWLFIGWMSPGMQTLMGTNWITSVPSGLGGIGSLMPSIKTFPMMTLSPGNWQVIYWIIRPRSKLWQRASTETIRLQKRVR